MEYKKTAFKTRTSWITKTFFLTIQESFFFFLILWTFWFLILVLHSEIFFLLLLYIMHLCIHRISLSQYCSRYLSKTSTPFVCGILYFIIIWVLQFLFLIWVTLQNKKNPLQPVGVWYTVLAIPPQYFNSNPARSSDGEGVKCDSERQVPGEEKSKG